jgi:2-keto-3-deoxy-6-phosphogluconate aldolase
MASFPGAYTPTEIVLAAECGAHAVKVFPAVSLGPEYFRAIRGPLPNILLVPTGGIHLHNMAAYLEAGAFALGIGSELVGKAELTSFNPEQLRQKAIAYAQAAKANAHA